MFGNIGPGFSHDRRIVYFLSDSSSGGSGDWYDVNWSNRIESEINATYVDEAIPVIPVFLSNISASCYTFWNTVKTDGSDLRVTAIDGTSVLPHYIVNFDSSSNIGILFVNVSGVIDTSSGGRFYIYYGNNSATTTSDSEAVFADTGYEAYYLPGMTTKNLVNNDLYELTAVNTPGTAASDWDGLTAATFNGSNQYFYNDSTQGVTGWPISQEALWYSGSATANQSVMSTSHTSGSANIALLRARGDVTGDVTDPLQVYHSGNGGTNATPNTSTGYSTSTWHYGAATRDANTGTSYVYLDGGNSGNSTTTLVSVSTFSKLGIGAFYYGTPFGYLNGRISQAAVSSVVRSANFVATNYDAWFQNDFITFDTNNIQNKP